ncbi:MAG: META domain-containing protein [Phycisphaerales bacterium]|jgi:heat shock protein HslJ
MLRPALLVTATLLLAACQTPARDLAGTWSLQEFVDAPAAPPIPPPGRTRPTVVFEPDANGTSGKVGGNGSINTFTGTYNASAGNIAVSSLGVTRRAGPSALLRLEQVYLGVIQTATTWHVKGDELLLSGAAGTVRFAREAAPPTEPAAPPADQAASQPAPNKPEAEPAAQPNRNPADPRSP